MGVSQKPIPPQPPRRTNTNRVFALTLIVGFGMGVVGSVMVFILLFLGGFFDGYLVVDQTACENACPPLALELYNTLEAEGLLGGEGLVIQADATDTETPTLEVVTMTPSATSTIDFGPTATAACATFSAQFPGTPCPTITATVTPSP